jgi:DNA replication protein DnaC
MTTPNNTIDAARVEFLLSELQLPSMRLRWAKLAEQSDKEGWPAARFLATLIEHEVADRSCRRMERHLAEARLPAGKTLASFCRERQNSTAESAFPGFFGAGFACQWEAGSLSFEG